MSQLTNEILPAPRYNARDAAIYRARLENAAIVMGSATPSLREACIMLKAGNITFLKSTERADGATLPTILIVDTIEARKKGQYKGTFTKELLDATQMNIPLLLS